MRRLRRDDVVALGRRKAVLAVEHADERHAARRLTHLRDATPVERPTLLDDADVARSDGLERAEHDERGDDEQDAAAACETAELSPRDRAECA